MFQNRKLFSLIKSSKYHSEISKLFSFIIITTLSCIRLDYRIPLSFFLMQKKKKKLNVLVILRYTWSKLYWITFVWSRKCISLRTFHNFTNRSGNFCLIWTIKNWISFLIEKLEITVIFIFMAKMSFLFI